MRSAPELAVVVPTFNERENLVPLLDALGRALDGLEYEVIVVDDDSPDGTAECARELAQRDYPRLRVVQRIHRRGLATAVVEGMMASSAPYLAVLDADMQHDETLLPAMLARLKAERLDLVIGTRHREGGSIGEFSAQRMALSGFGRFLSRTISKANLSDPMSGFFVLTRTYLDEVARSLSDTGFKILLDMVASARRPVRFAEMGYTFRPRLRGESKLDVIVTLEYLELVIDKLIGAWIPATYVIYAAIGSAGLIGYLAGFRALRASGASFQTAQVAASSAVILLNFWLNNRLTFRSVRLRGSKALGGMLLFACICVVGLVCNVQVADFLGRSGVAWYLASAGGLAIGSAWNYLGSSILVWQVNRRRRGG